MYLGIGIGLATLGLRTLMAMSYFYDELVTRVKCLTQILSNVE